MQQSSALRVSTLSGAFLALALAGGATAAQGPSLQAALPEARADEPDLLAPMGFHDARLRAMVEDLERSSPTAAKMLLTIRRAGFPLEFGTFGDLAEEMSQEYRSWDRAQGVAGYMAPVVRRRAGFSVTTVKILVAVNLATLDELFERAYLEVPEPAVPWAEIHRLETLSVLAHEIVHAYGLALAGGDPRGGCHDPEPGQRPEESCVMNGENLIRKEIGAPLAWDYGFPSIVRLAQRYAEAEQRRARLREIASVRLPVRQALPERSPLRQVRPER